VAAYGSGKACKENETEILAKVKAELELQNRRANMKKNKGLEFYLLRSRVWLPNEGTGCAIAELCWRKERLRKGVVLQNESRMQTKRLEGGLWGHPMGWPLGPTYESRSLNIKDRKSGPYIQRTSA